MSSSGEKTVGCIGKCTTGLTTAELDQITDDIHETLHHQKGREIFKNYLKKWDLDRYIEYLELYEQCSAIIEEQTKLTKSKRESSVESLVTDVRQVKEGAELLSGTPEIDREFLDHINEALEHPTRESLLEVLEETRGRCRNHLSVIHKNFKDYASQPCPLTK